MQDFNLLETSTLPKGAAYYHPERPNALVKLDSPAIEVFTDFKSKTPATITADHSIQMALDEMRLTKVKSLIVVDKDDSVIGYVSARGVQGARLGRLASENSVDLKDVTVGMAMLSIDEMICIRYAQLDRIQVGHITKLFHEKGRAYIFVTEPHPTDSNRTQIRGLFSISRISRQLGETVSRDLSSHTLADMNRRID